MKVSFQFNAWFCMVIVISTISFLSCRSELDEETGLLGTENLGTNQNIINLLLNTTSNDGSKDNILDKSSCFTVNLPVTIIIDESQFEVVSEADFETVEELLQEGQLQLDFIYPITLLDKAFNEFVVQDRNELNALINDCESTFEDDDIECIDFTYPLTLSVFNQSNELINTLLFNNDREFYDFLEGVDENLIVNINYPITLIFPDESLVEVNSSESLENLIEAADENCEENDLTESEFTEVLLSDLFVVEQYIEDNDNQTPDFQELYFQFLENKTIQVFVEAENGGDINGFDTVATGNWAVRIRAGGRPLGFFFDVENTTLPSRLNDTFDIINVTNDQIRLENNESDSQQKLLIFEKRSR